MTGTARSLDSAQFWPVRQHGGPDALGVPRFDFSTNSNACGPCPLTLAAVQNADTTRYPDPRYTDLKHRLADFHGVDINRLVLAGSASEFIFRFTAWLAQQTAGQGPVCFPAHSYGDYAQAAQGWGLAATTDPDAAQLVWACEPSSPLGQASSDWPQWLQSNQPATAQLVLDCAYAPLRLSGAATLTATQRNRVWQLYSPNKSLGLTGVRAGYALAPLGSEVTVLALERLCPSWTVGAHGVAMLQAWVQPDVQAWIGQSLFTLGQWKERQIRLLAALGWTLLSSEANFFCARVPVDDLAAELQRLRVHGIKLRDCASFGLPGHVRLCVLPSEAQDALYSVLCLSN